MTMAATLQIFTRALQTPDLSFRTLQEARAVTDACGMPRLMRTTRFVEAEIEWHERRWLLALPLSPASLCMAERALLRIGTLRSEWITECRLLRGEMVWTGPTGTPQSCDLLLQHLPEGRSFDEALGCEGAERLLGELDALRGELRRLNLAHGNLHRGNIRWTGRRFVPIRYYDARFGAPERDDAAFEALREEILRQGGSPQAGDVEAPYEAGCTLTGHRWTSNLFEGLICVEDDAGYGYVDAQNRTVIPAQFLWAGDFREGRAEVQTPEGMGLIDRQGRYIIPAEYEIVTYVPAESISKVRKNGRWALFDYLGRRITEFVDDGERLGVWEEA